MNGEKYCLVLSGGGAKGVYHVGAWRALQKIGIKVNAFIGNSIGAVIAGFLAQRKYKEIEKIAGEIGIDFILNIPDELIEDGEVTLNNASFESFKKFYKSAVEKKGLDTSPLRDLLYEHLDDMAIRKTGNDLGVVTYSVTDLKAREVFIEDMEEGKILDYLLASSAFPGFQSPEIAGKKYIDGGVYDNIPYTMARQRGYNHLIVIDISGVGAKRKLKVEGGTTVYIKNSIDMGGVLDFSKEFLNDYCTLGYLDTMRTFDKLKGHKYYFRPDSKFEKRFNNYIEKPENREMIIACAAECKNIKKTAYSDVLKKILPEHSQYSRDRLPVFIDSAAASLSLERIRERSYLECFSEIEEKLSTLRESVEKLGECTALEIEQLVRKELKEKQFINAPYYYFLLVDQFLPGKIQGILKKSLCDFYPELAAGHTFLTLLIRSSGESEGKTGKYFL